MKGRLEFSRVAWVLALAALGAGAGSSAPAGAGPNVAGAEARSAAETGTGEAPGKEAGSGEDDTGPPEAANGAGGRRPRPIAESVERAVDELMRKHFSSCGRGDQDVPCFPLTVERKWQYSVAESLEHLEFDDSPTPGRPPTVGEMSQARPGPLSASGSVGFDPVCKGKQLLKAITGKSRTYYLYKVWDDSGERAVLRDAPLDAEHWSSAPDFHYVELGTFGDECEALAAWRRELREIRARQEGSAAATFGEPDEDETKP